MGLMFIFLLLAMVHGLGTLTNLIALCRKEILPKTPMINVNNMNDYVNMPNKKIKQEIEQDVPKQEIIEDFEDINIETYNRDIPKQIKQKPRTEQPKSEEVKMPNKVKRNVPYEYNGGIVYIRK
jgi:hypothetical protein